MGFQRRGIGLGGTSRRPAEGSSVEPCIATLEVIIVNDGQSGAWEDIQGGKTKG